MGKKKREHIVFDQMLKEKKHIPITQVNRQVSKSDFSNSTGKYEYSRTKTK